MSRTTARITLTNALGKEVEFEVSFDPLHRGLQSAMNRAARSPRGVSRLAGGAVVIRKRLAAAELA